MTYPAEALFEEVGYVAWHLHWSLEEILDLDHATRHAVIDVVGNLAARV